MELNCSTRRFLLTLRSFDHHREISRKREEVEEEEEDDLEEVGVEAGVRLDLRLGIKSAARVRRMGSIDLQLMFTATCSWRRKSSNDQQEAGLLTHVLQHGLYVGPF